MSQEKFRRRRFLADLLFAGGALSAAALVARIARQQAEPRPPLPGEPIAPQTPTSPNTPGPDPGLDGDVGPPDSIRSTPEPMLGGKPAAPRPEPVVKGKVALPRGDDRK